MSLLPIRGWRRRPERARDRRSRSGCGRRGSSRDGPRSGAQRRARDGGARVGRRTPGRPGGSPRAIRRSGSPSGDRSRSPRRRRSDAPSTRARRESHARRRRTRRPSARQRGRCRRAPRAPRRPRSAIGRRRRWKRLHRGGGLGRAAAGGPAGRRRAGAGCGDGGAGGSGGDARLRIEHHRGNQRERVRDLAAGPAGDAPRLFGPVRLPQIEAPGRALVPAGLDRDAEGDRAAAVIAVLDESRAGRPRTNGAHEGIAIGASGRSGVGEAKARALRLRPPRAPHERGARAGAARRRTKLLRSSSPAAMPDPLRYLARARVDEIDVRSSACIPAAPSRNRLEPRGEEVGRQA